MNIYTVWGPDEKSPEMLIGAEDPPRYTNGELIDPKVRLLHRFEANSWEEACQKYKDLFKQGKAK